MSTNKHAHDCCRRRPVRAPPTAHRAVRGAPAAQAAAWPTSCEAPCAAAPSRGRAAARAGAPCLRPAPRQARRARVGGAATAAQGAGPGARRVRGLARVLAGAGCRRAAACCAGRCPGSGARARSPHEGRQGRPGPTRRPPGRVGLLRRLQARGRGAALRGARGTWVWGPRLRWRLRSCCWRRRSARTMSLFRRGCCRRRPPSAAPRWPVRCASAPGLCMRLAVTPVAAPLLVLSRLAHWNSLQ